MISENLKNLNDLGIYPIMSLLLFLFAFVMIILRVVTADKSYLKQMEELPLDIKNNDSNNIGI